MEFPEKMAEIRANFTDVHGLAKCISLDYLNYNGKKAEFPN